jgi:hypothetical protein
VAFSIFLTLVKAMLTGSAPPAADHPGRESSKNPAILCTKMTKFCLESGMNFGEKTLFYRSATEKSIAGKKKAGIPAQERSERVNGG